MTHFFKTKYVSICCILLVGLFCGTVSANHDFVCITSTEGDGGECDEGAWGPWDEDGCRIYTGVSGLTGTWIWGNTREGCSGERMFNGQLENGVVTNAQLRDHEAGMTLGNTTFNPDGTFTSTANGVCEREQCDTEPPNCTTVIDWEQRPIINEIGECDDGGGAGCDPDSYTEEPFDKDTQPTPVRACDIAGNCADCDDPPIDTEPPTCTATFEHPDRWHNGEDFETDPPLRCWLEACQDAATNGEVSSGCIQIPVLGETPQDFDDPDGENENFEVVVEELQPVNNDTCTIQVCDNAGWCNTCESPELDYDDTEVCSAGNAGLGKTADGTLCGECDPDDDDCLCIKGDASKCRDGGPVNCYTNPFHDRCPGFQNPACLADPFTPGCPVVNPCYPVQVYDGVICPRDAMRFCARNPYHYGCNLACAIDAIDCDPVPPGDGGTDGGGTGNGGNCPELPACGAGETLVDDGLGADGCPVAHCEPSTQLAGLDEACPSSAACQAGLTCSVEYDVCNTNPGCTGGTCTTECWGTCIEPVVQDTTISIQHSATQPSVVLPSSAVLTEVYRFTVSADTDGAADLGRVTLTVDLNGIDFAAASAHASIARPVANGTVDDNVAFPTFHSEISEGDIAVTISVDLSGQRVAAGGSLEYAVFLPPTREVGDAENSDGLSALFINDDPLQLSPTTKADLTTDEADVIWSDESAASHSDTTEDWWNGSLGVQVDATAKRLTK